MESQIINSLIIGSSTILATVLGASTALLMGKKYCSARGFKKISTKLFAISTSF